MNESPIMEVQNIGHLGLIASIAKKYKFVERIDRLLPKKGHNQKLSHGNVVLAMIYQGLGLSPEKIYLAEKFFSNLPLEKLFCPGVVASDFKKDTYARTLDAIHQYGPTKFFMDTGFNILMINNLLSKFAHLDTTSLSFGNKKRKDNGLIKITHGHSKDHRHDLPQLVLLLITTHDGLPFWSESFSGNVSDKEIFEKAIIDVQGHLRKSTVIHDFIYIADSALYTQAFLLNKEISGNWITRVPESILKAREKVERKYDKILWDKVDDDYKIMEILETYGGVTQRWILVRHRKSKYKELATFKRNLVNQEENIKKIVGQLHKNVFFSKEEISLRIQILKEKFKCYLFDKQIRGHYKGQRGLKRKILVGYQVEISYKKNEPAIRKMENKKGKFILATNILEDKGLSAREILGAYRDQNKNIESCFKFIKDKTYKLSTISQTKPSRIEAMLPVISLILLLNNLGKMDLQEELAKKNSTIPNQIGKEIKNPTLKWAFQLLRKVTRVRVSFSGKIFEQFKEIGEVQKLIIESFGSYAKDIYGFT